MIADVCELSSLACGEFGLGVLTATPVEPPVPVAARIVIDSVVEPEYDRQPWLTAAPEKATVIV
jgi:hypothetical protein